MTVADVLVQLRCRQCGKRPASIALLEHGAARAHGRMGAQGWWVMLVGSDLLWTMARKLPEPSIPNYPY